MQPNGLYLLFFLGGGSEGAVATLFPFAVSSQKADGNNTLGSFPSEGEGGFRKRERKEGAFLGSIFFFEQDKDHGVQKSSIVVFVRAKR